MIQIILAIIILLFGLFLKRTNHPGFRSSKKFAVMFIVFNAPFYNITASPQRRIILNFEIPADEDISKAQKGILEVVKNLENVDRLDSVEVIFTDLKQGIFNLQAKFWMKIGANMVQLKSEAYLKIKQRLDTDGIQLVTPTSISITNGEVGINENHDK